MSGSSTEHRSPESDLPAASLPQSSPPTLNKLKAVWKNIRGKVESERPPLAVPLSRAIVDAIDGNAVVLKLPDSVSVEILRGHIKLIEAAIYDIVGASLKVIPKVDSNRSAGPTPSTAKSRASKPANTPTVQPGEDADALFQYANERIRER